MILGILQARTSSSRLPGKVLMPLAGEPMLVQQVKRLRKSKTLDQLVVATSGDTDDDDLARCCEGHSISVYRGDLDNVLDRFYQCAKQYEPDHVVRLTGDCPLADSAVLDEIVRYHLAEGNDYSSNTINPTFPDGLDVEVLSMRTLETAWQNAELPSELEHVTPFVIARPTMFRCGSYEHTENLSAQRWTVDEPEDLEFVRAVYEKLYGENDCFGMGDVLELLDAEPQLMNMNRQFSRNEGMQASLEADAEFLEKGDG